jgi:hypothetical protein
MAILVKHIKAHPSGRREYRRAFAPALRPFIAGKSGIAPREFKVSLGRLDAPDFDAKHAAATRGSTARPTAC